MGYKQGPTSREAILGAGIKLSLITAVFSGLAVFFNRFVVKAVGDPLVFTTLKNLGVALVIGWLLGKKTYNRQIKWKKIKKSDWLKLGLIGVIGGSLPFYLFYKGLMLASSAQAGLIHKLLVILVAMWAVPVLKEKISLKQAGVLGAIFLSNFVIGGLGQWQWGVGETMILIATLLWAVENVIAKIVLKKVEADVVVGARMILGSVILLIAAILSGRMGLVFKLNLEQWGMTLVTIGMLTGYVMSWYRALKKAPVTLVATVLSLGSIVTNVLSSIFITHNLTIGLLGQSILLLVFVVIFVKEVRGNAGSIALR